MFTFLELLFTNPGFYVLWVAIVMFSISFHEFAHAWVALGQGDPTAREAGHLTLNPIRQMGFMSIAMLMLIGLAWGAVPVSPERMRRRYSHALVAASGPLANVLLFLVFGLLMALTIRFGDLVFGPEVHRVVFMMFGLGSILNLVLAALNLLPLPFLDGWTVLSYLFPGLLRVPADVQKGLALVLVGLLLFKGMGLLALLVKPIIVVYFKLLQADAGLSLLSIFTG